MSVPDVFRRITTALDQAGIAYMVTGSFASAHYGSPRSTQDIDLVIESTADRLAKFVGALPGNEYYVELDAALRAQQKESIFNVIDLATGWKIDFIVRKSRAFSREEFRRQQISSQGVTLYIHGDGGGHNPLNAGMGEASAIATTDSRCGSSPASPVG